MASGDRSSRGIHSATADAFGIERDLMRAADLRAVMTMSRDQRIAIEAKALARHIQDHCVGAALEQRSSWSWRAVPTSPDVAFHEWRTAPPHNCPMCGDDRRAKQLAFHPEVLERVNELLCIQADMDATLTWHEFGGKIVYDFAVSW